jgi:hypothetical protein
MIPVEKTATTHTAFSEGQVLAVFGFALAVLLPVLLCLDWRFGNAGFG